MSIHFFKSTIKFANKRTFASSNHNLSIWRRVKAFIFSSDEESFNKDQIEDLHAKDGIDEKHFTLIYRDIGASRTFFMTSAFLPCFLTSSAIFCYDVINNQPQNRMEVVQKLVTDADELGYLIIFPEVGLFLVICLLVRIQQLRILRIYQNRTNVDEFIAIRAKNLIFKNKLHFTRPETTGFYFAENQTDGYRVLLNFLLGNVRIGKSRYILIEDMFKANNFRSYMLNETSVPPRL